MPAAEEERHRERGERDQVDVLRRLEESPPHAAVFGVVAGDELRIGLGEVEGRATGFGNPGEEEAQEADELRPEEPEGHALLVHDVDQAERLPHQHHPEHAQRERHLVGDELRARPHRAEQ